MLYALPIIICVCWMIGGQLNKAVRRFCIPSLAVAVTLWRAFLNNRSKNPRVAWAAFAWCLVIPILSMGYGVDSWLGKIFKKELTLRMAYAIMCSLPFLIFERVTGEPWWLTGVTVVALVVAFQVRADKLGTWGKFDFLIEDIVRGLVFGTLVAIHIALTPLPAGASEESLYIPKTVNSDSAPFTLTSVTVRGSEWHGINDWYTRR